MITEKVRIGAVTYDPKVVGIWEGISRYLNYDAKFPAEVLLFLSYSSQVEALLRGTIDIAWNTNLAYLQSEAWTEKRTTSVAMRDTDRNWETVLVAPTGSGVQGVHDLRGRVLALGSRDSGHSAILPVFYLGRDGLVEGMDYRSLRFNSDIGKHGDTGASEKEVLASVLDGRADAGFLGSPFWDGLVAKGLVDVRAIAPVWRSPPFSHCMFTARPGLPSVQQEEFRAALQAMDPGNPEHSAILEAEGLKRWLPPTEEGYDDLRTAAREQGFFRRGSA